MMVKRKLGGLGAVEKSSTDQEICKSDATVATYITCEKSGGLLLTELGLMAGSP